MSTNFDNYFSIVGLFSNELQRQMELNLPFCLTFAAVPTCEIWDGNFVANHSTKMIYASTLASCSFIKNGLILIIFGKRHQRTTRNDMHVQLSLSLHFYLLYLLLSSCGGDDAFWCHTMLMKQSSSFNRKHRTLSLQICVRQTVRLTTEFVDWCRNMCTLYIHLSATPAAVASSNVSLTRGQAYHKTSSTVSSWSMEKVVTCKHEGKMASL